MGRNIMKYLNVFFLLVGVWLLSACSGNLSTKVFLDANSDNLAGSNEPLLANMPATLYRDGSQVEKLMTDSEGKVSFLISQKGKYCVRLDRNEVSQIRQEAPKALASSKALGVESDPESTPDATPNSSPQPSPSPAAQTSSQPVISTKAYEACAETNGPLNISLEVPVPFDFAETIASIPEPDVVPVNPGEEIEIPIVFPRHCRLKTLTLPDGVGVPKATEEMIRVINNWSEVIALGAKPIVDEPPLAINRDTLRQFPLKLRVTDKILDLDPPRLEITPQVSCPAGLDYELKTHVLETGGKKMFEIYHDREGDAVAGGEVTIVTHVLNHSELYVPASDLRLTFTQPQYGNTSFDPECGSSHCSFALQPQQHKELRTKIKIPDVLTQTLNFELSAQLKVTLEGHEKIFTEEAPSQFGVLP
jgi:hypothetical protein